MIGNSVKQLYLLLLIFYYEEYTKNTLIGLWCVQSWSRSLNLQQCAQEMNGTWWKTNERYSRCQSCHPMIQSSASRPKPLSALNELKTILSMNIFRCSGCICFTLYCRRNSGHLVNCSIILFFLRRPNEWTTPCLKTISQKNADTPSGMSVRIGTHIATYKVVHTCIVQTFCSSVSTR